MGRKWLIIETRRHEGPSYEKVHVNKLTPFLMVSPQNCHKNIHIYIFCPSPSVITPVQHLGGKSNSPVNNEDVALSGWNFLLEKASNLYFCVLWWFGLISYCSNAMEGINVEVRCQVIADFYRKKWPFFT